MPNRKHHEITMTGVKSSQLHSMGYDEKTNTLAVKFHNGGTYHYAGISKVDFDKLSKAESIGTHFGKHIRSKPFTKLPAHKAK